MVSWRGASSGKVCLELDREGRPTLTAPGYRRLLPYPVSFLDKLGAAYPGPTLVEELLVAEEPGRLGHRVRALIRELPRGCRVLHWGAAALGATVSIARLGVRIDAVDSNPLYGPLGRERIRWAGLEESVRVLHINEVEDEYDLLLLIGDPVLRPSPPKDQELDQAIDHLCPDGRIALVAWPYWDRPSPLRDSWSVVSRAGPLLVRQRLLRPRGKAPIPTLRRRFAGWALVPLASAVPGIVLRLLGEQYEILHRRRSDEADPVR